MATSHISNKPIVSLEQCNARLFTSQMDPIGSILQEIVTFLASVPLFKSQLPRSELPMARQPSQPETDMQLDIGCGYSFEMIILCSRIGC